jgi:feruloyl esterase
MSGPQCLRFDTSDNISTLRSIMVYGLNACQQLATTLNALPDVAVLNTTHLTGGAIIALPGLVPSCANSAGYSAARATTDLCRAVINVKTSSSSTDRIEAWLSDDWNGRFLATGNGGTGGCIDYGNLMNGASFGFATFGTNGGHE